METLTSHDQITDALKSSLALLEGKSDEELQQIFVTHITVSGEDFCRDQALMRWAVRRIAELKREIVALKDRNAMTEIYLFKFLDEFEGAWDNSETCASPEIALDYLAAAKHCADKLGRKNNRIEGVQKWVNNYLPFNS